MSDDYLEETCAFAEAEISTHPDLGFLAVRLIRFDPKPPHDLVSGVLHRLRPEHVEDLIGHLQASLAQYRSSSEHDSAQGTKH